MKYMYNGDEPPYLDHVDELEARRREYYDALQKAEAAFDRAVFAMAKAQEKFETVQRSWRGNDSFLSIELNDLERDANEFAEAVENFKLEAENEQSKFREWGSEKR